MHRVLISDPLAEEGLALLRRAEGIELDNRSGLKGSELRAALAECEGVIIRSGTRLTADLLQGQTRLKAIVRAGVGVDNIDVDAATREGVVVMNTPGGNTTSTAEHTIALLLALMRHVPAADASLRAGRWDRNKFVGTQLAGKTLGVVGLGRVGLAVAKRAIGLEMRVLGYDPFMAPERAAELGIQTVSDLAEIFPKVDVLTVHVPLSDETKGLVGAQQLGRMQQGAYVLNCARGGIVDEAALVEALKSGHIAGAALDVFEQEPPTDSPFPKLPNVVLTPHLGASTAEAQLNVAIEAAQLMVDFFTTGNVRYSVNITPLDRTELEDARRHLDIAHRLGILQAQLVKGAIRKATIQFRGEAAKKKTRLLTGAFAMGLLEYALEEQVNLVNAELIARERGIQLVEQVSSEPSDFSTLLRAEVVTDQETFVVAGTTRGAQFNRLVQIGPYRLDAFLDGTMVVFQHDDKPGLIGVIGTVMGKYGVNIAQMTVGRKQPGGQAIGLLSVDSEPPKAAIQEIQSDERVTSVRVVKLPPFGVLPDCFR
jgi:D-3-phosphoglycerate dehydrogenase